MSESPNEELGCAGILLASAIGLTLLIWAITGFPAFWR